MILKKFRKKTEKPVVKKKVFYFFETIANSVFITITGMFVTLFLIFVSLSSLFFDPLYIQIILFTLLGVVVFSISYKFFLKYNVHILRNLTYENFLNSRKKLLLWVFWTFSFYLIFCWFMLIILGTSHGFKLTFPTNDGKYALLITSPETTKILGFILLSVHLFLLVLFKTIFYYWDKIFAFAYNEFEKRKRNLELVRNKANLK